MCLQFADFDADGHEDIVTAVWEGTVYTLPGSAKGFGKPSYVKDAKDELILLSRYYDMKDNEYKSADPKKPGEHLISALAWDWDEDGDFDLLLGAKTGQIYLRRNEGTAAHPKFSSANLGLTAGNKPFTVPGGSTAPRTVDWDGDGLTDLVCGSFKGGVHWYRNVGQKGAPRFAAPVTLLKTCKSTPDVSAPETSWYVEPTDYDGDGDLDLVVGGFFMQQPKARQLNEKQKARLAQVDADLKRVSSEWSDMYQEVSEKAKDLDKKEARKLRAELYARKEFRAVQKEMMDLRKERNELVPRAARKSGVWLFRRQNGARVPAAQESRR